MHEKYVGMCSKILAKIATNKIIFVYRINWTIPQPRVQGYLQLGDSNLRNLVQQELHIPARPGKGKGPSTPRKSFRCRNENFSSAVRLRYFH